LELLTIDFETHYSRDFNLKKQTTEAYIRDRRFEVVGVGVKRDDEPTVWFSGTHKRTREFLAQFNWGESAALAHNAAFDMAILNWCFGIRPKRILDTMSMSRAVHGTEISAALASLATHYELGEKGTEVHDAIGKKRLSFSKEELAKYGAYCKQDVELTYLLLKKLTPLVPLTELRLIDLTIRMFSEPELEIDSALLETHLQSIVESKAKTLEEVGIAKEELMSNPKFAAALRKLNITPPVKTSKTTGKETFAFSKTDEGFKELLEHDDLKVQTLVSARLKIKSTIEETRTARFIEIGKRGPIPIPLRYYAAHTGRWGGDDKVNLQNLPRGSVLKDALVAPPGHVVIDSDSSQIEARTLAWLADQKDLVKAFSNGDDVYKIMASKIYNKPEEDINKDERFVGKTTILGCGYGMGAVRFRDQLSSFGVDVSEGEAASIVEAYRSSYASIPKLWNIANKALDFLIRRKPPATNADNLVFTMGTGGLIVADPDREALGLPNGLSIRYPNLRTEGYELVYDTKRGASVTATKIYGGKVIENLCQALARIIIGEQMLKIASRYKVVMTVHDAVCCVVPEAEAEEAKEFVMQCMREAPAWAKGLPLNCEAGIGASYGGCK